jgi:TonB family protein
MPSSPSAFSVATGQTDGCMFYLSYLSRKIKMNWFPPRICQGYIPTVATFKIRSDGNLSDVRIVQSSGISIADNAALAAIKNAAPFGSLLQGWPPEVEIQFRFDYNVFRQKSEAAIRTLSHKQILLDSCAE